jgi:hypothetical protein
MSRPGARAASRFNRSVKSEPLVLRMHRSELSAAIVARPSGWLTSTFRMAICRDTHNSTLQLETVPNVVLPGWVVYGPFKLARWGNAATSHVRYYETVMPD